MYRIKGVVSFVSRVCCFFLIVNAFHCAAQTLDTAGLVFWIDGQNVHYDMNSEVDTVYNKIAGNSHGGLGFGVPAKDSLPTGFNQKGIHLENSIFKFNQIIVNNTDFTHIVFFMPTQVTFPGTNQGWFSDCSGGNSNRFIFPVVDDGLNVLGRLGDNPNLGNDNPFVKDSLYLMSSVADLSNGLSVFLNQNLHFSQPTLNSSVAGSDYFIGGRNSGSGAFMFKGILFEHLIYNKALTLEELNGVETYLVEKYFPKPDLGPDKIITVATVCPIQLSFDTTNFSGPYLWSNGDTTHSINVSSPGEYWVRATNSFGFDLFDTLVVSTEYTAISDTTICSNDTLTWDPGLGLGYHFLWSDGDTTLTNQFTDVGNHWVEITNDFGCLYRDTIILSVDSFPETISLGPDKTLCQGGVLGLLPGASPTSFLWSTGDTLSQTIIDTAGNYWVQVGNNFGCVAQDTVQISVNGIAPTVGFDTQLLCSNEPVPFVDTSSTDDGSNIINWNWDFGDGDTSSVQHPNHQFSSVGPFNISLEITTDSGCVNSISRSLLLYFPPDANFDFPPVTDPSCEGQAIQMTDGSQSANGLITDWNWNFGDTGVLDTSTLVNPSYVFAQTGSYNVKLVIMSSFGCSDSITKSINILETPIPSFTYSNSCVGKATSFTNTSTLSNIFSWDFGNGNTSPFTDPQHTYTSSGNYNVTLITTNINSCVDTLVTQITVNDNPVASFSSEGFCVLTNGQLYDSSSTTAGVIDSWNWDVVGHLNQSSDQHPNFLFGVSDVGSFLVDLIVGSSVGCTDSIRDTIYVHALPVPQFSFTPATGAPPLTVTFSNQTIDGDTYSWDFGDDSTSTLVSPNHIYLDSGTYAIDLVATSINGCVDSTSKSLYVVIPDWDVSVDNLFYHLDPNTNFLSVSAQMTNHSNIDVVGLDLFINASSYPVISENFIGTIGAGGQIVYQFSSSFRVIDGQVPDVICVQALNPNGETDINPTNNEYCLASSEFLVISLYPNPAVDLVNMEYTLPSDGDVVIRLHNSAGQLVAEFFKGEGTEGLNRHQFNLTPFGKGIYYMEVEFDGERMRERLLISE